MINGMSNMDNGFENIAPLNHTEDDRLDMIRKSIENNGWNDEEPIMMYDRLGNGFDIITGSHRITVLQQMAYEEIEIDFTVVFVNDEIDKWIDAGNDYGDIEYDNLMEIFAGTRHEEHATVNDFGA